MNHSTSARLFASVLLLAGLGVGGCYRSATVSTNHADRGTTAGVNDSASVLLDTGWQQFGEPVIAALPVVDVADVLASPASYEGRDVQLQGTISEVCAKKGCWLRIADPAGGQETIFVKFTCPIDADARLIPADAAGKPVVVQGQVVVEEMSEDQARHFAEDAGKSAEEVAAIVGPQKTIRVMSPSAKVAAN